MSLNPFIADIGNLLPNLVSGSVLVSLVLSLPTVGPILLGALKTQDQFLAGFILMFVAVLTVIGMLVSDLLLAWLDPRIRIGEADDERRGRPSSATTSTPPRSIRGERSRSARRARASTAPRPGS
jgi:hypothetical protein